MMRTPSQKRHALKALLQQYPGTSCAAQCQRIRAILSQFSVTTFELMRFADVYDPRARVMQLRAQGERIDTHWKTIHTESGDKHRVGVYTLRPTTTKP
jgi:hypothetical protein